MHSINYITEFITKLLIVENCISLNVCLRLWILILASTLVKLSVIFGLQLCSFDLFSGPTSYVVVILKKKTRNRMKEKFTFLG